MSIINLINGDIIKLECVYPMRLIEIYDTVGNGLITDNNFMYLKYEEGGHFLIYKGNKEINISSIQTNYRYYEKEPMMIYIQKIENNDSD